MPKILADNQFEAESGLYFERTMYWHAQRGDGYTGPGFRMMELHSLLFDFCIPYFNHATMQPVKAYPKTFKKIDALEGTNKVLMTQQAKLGIESGRSKLIPCCQEYLFVAPICFLLLLNKQIGPSIFHAIIPILKDKGIDLVGNATGWGTKLQDDEPWYNYFLHTCS